MAPSSPQEADSQDVILEMRDVHAAYHGDISILNGLSLKARRGQITGIIGPNGAGKSTALKTLYGFLRPTHGAILHLGQQVNQLAPWDMVARGISFVPQNRSLFSELSVEDNLALGCWNFRRDKARIRRGLDRIYEMFPILAEKRNDPAGSMSGGQQRFLELGRSLILEPEMVLLDEPTAMIAPKISRELYSFIRGLPAQGVTVILVDQNVRQCVEVSDYVYVLDLGRNRGEGERAAFGDDATLRSMIQEWLDYQID